METRKSNTKRRVVFSVVSIVTVFAVIGFISLNANNPVVQAPTPVEEEGIMTSGGYPSGEDLVREEFEIHQDQEGEVFNDLHFKVWQKEGGVKINGWTVAVTHFTEADSKRSSSPLVVGTDEYPGYHAVDCDFWGTDIPYCTWLTINIDLWLSDYNTMRVTDFYWTIDGERAVDLPDFAWNINAPAAAQAMAAAVITAQPTAAASFQSVSTLSTTKGTVSAYLHEVTFSNDDSKAELLIKGLTVMVSPDNVKDLKDIDFSKSKTFADFVLEPGKSKVIEVFTDKPYIGDHIYLNYHVFNTANPTEAVYRNVIADHPVFVPPQ